MENEYEKTKRLLDEIAKLSKKMGCVVVIGENGANYVLDQKGVRKNADNLDGVLDILYNINDASRLVSRIQTPDGTILTSEFTHDFVTYTDKNGEKYMLDGGAEYQRTYINNEPAVDVSIYTYSPFEEIRKYVKRGTFDKNGDRIWVPVYKLSDSHLKNILAYNKEKGIPDNKFSDVIVREIEYRKENGIVIEDYEYCAQDADDEKRTQDASGFVEKQLDFINNKAFELVKEQLKGEAKDYVILKEDENGRYIEYAFLNGAPKNNRCLSWYDKLQPNALKRNGHDEKSWKLHEVGKIYKLHMFNCGNENSEDPDKRCFPGEAAPHCLREGWAKYWTKEEPVKCGCWYLEELPCEVRVPVTFAKDLFLEIMKELNKVED